MSETLLEVYIFKLGNRYIMWAELMWVEINFNHFSKLYYKPKKGELKLTIKEVFCLVTSSLTGETKVTRCLRTDMCPNNAILKHTMRISLHGLLAKVEKPFS